MSSKNPKSGAGLSGGSGPAVALALLPIYLKDSNLDANLVGVDMSPKPLYSNKPYCLSDVLAVDAVGGLKVGTDDGIKFPDAARRPAASVNVGGLSATFERSKVGGGPVVVGGGLNNDNNDYDGSGANASLFAQDAQGAEQTSMMMHRAAGGGGGGAGGDAAAAQKGGGAGGGAARERAKAGHEPKGGAHDGAKGGTNQAKNEDEVVITLTETKTDFLLDIWGSAVPNDFPQYQKIQKRNEAYKKVLEKRAQGAADNLNERHTQTINFAQKTKVVEAKPPVMTEMSCQASEWDIYDSTHFVEGVEGDDHGGPVVAASSSSSSGAHKKKGDPAVEALVASFTAALTSADCMLDVSEAKTGTSAAATTTNNNNNAGATAAPAGTAAAAANYLPQPPGSAAAAAAPPGVTSDLLIAESKNAKIMSSDSLLSNLHLVERAVQQNLNHERHLRYRDYPSSADAEIKPDESLAKGNNAEDDDNNNDENSGFKMSDVGSALDTISSQLDDKKSHASMDKLFTFNCAMAKGRTATSMSWNKVNKDILAVGYGSFHLTASEKEGGVIMFWSMRNPSHPEKVIKTVSGVTAIDFSSAHPNMLAVGMYNGTVAIYDTRKEEDFDVPVLESGAMGSKHMDPVWQVKWVDKGPERGESLVTIATDGRVLEWSMKKGLMMTPLMVLKRIGNSDGVISRQASGLCLDFPLGDSSVYFAGTEDGHIHRCSCSYNEQYLDTFSGHAGPVYKVKCSPFHPDAFLSCSADWTVKLWSSKKTEHVLDFHSVDLSEVVNDIAWCPTASTVFASVTGDGRVEVWDLDYSHIDPKLFYRPSKAEAILGVTPLTSVLFSDNAPVLATGDANGKVEIFRLTGVMETDGGPDVQAARLQKVLGQKKH